MRKKIFSLRDPFPEKNDVSAIVVDKYVPKVNYGELEITPQEKEDLIEYEKGVLFHGNKMQDHLLGISENLYKAQGLLADHRGGTFYKWFEGLGLKKDFVYMCIKRYDLYLRYKREEVMKLPDRVVKEVTKLSKDLGEDRVYEIIEAPKPTEKIKEFKHWLMERSLREENTSIDKKVQERRNIYKKELVNVQDEIYAIQRRLKELKKQERVLEEALRELD